MPLMTSSVSPRFSSLRLKVIEMPGLGKIIADHKGSKQQLSKDLARYMGGPHGQVVQEANFDPHWRQIHGVDPQDFFGASRRLFVVGDLLFLIGLSADKGKRYNDNRYYDSDKLVMTYYSGNNAPASGKSFEGSSLLNALTHYFGNSIDSLRKGNLTKQERDSRRENICKSAKRLWVVDGKRLLESLSGGFLSLIADKGIDSHQLYKLVDEALKGQKLRLGDLNR